MARKQTFLNATMERTERRRDAGKVLAYVTQWVIVHSEHGRRPTVQEYADYWGVSLATAYREQVDFREVWPEFMTPTDVALVLGLDPANPSSGPAPIAWLNPIAQEG